MVLRVSALRGTVPAQWSSDFGTALEGYGVAAVRPRPQMADIWRDLGGAPLAGAAAGGAKGGKAQKPSPPTNVDAVTLGDVWLQPAIAQGLLQPIPHATDRRWWVSDTSAPPGMPAGFCMQSNPIGRPSSVTPAAIASHAWRMAHPAF